MPETRLTKNEKIHDAIVTPDGYKYILNGYK